MELEDLFVAWKSQDHDIDQHLKKETFHYLFKQKSKGVLSQIIKTLTLELVILFLLVAGFNVLFFLVELPFNILRWGSFVIFNTVALSFIIRYIKTIHQIKPKFSHDVCQTLKQIMHHLNRFRRQGSYLNAPIGVIIVMMFAGSQHLLYWLPWLITEFFLWRWLFIPKIKSRFENYIMDLENSLSTLKEVKS